MTTNPAVWLLAGIVILALLTRVRLNAPRQRCPYCRAPVRHGLLNLHVHVDHAEVRR